MYCFSTWLLVSTVNKIDSIVFFLNSFTINIASAKLGKAREKQQHKAKTHPSGTECKATPTSKS